MEKEKLYEKVLALHVILIYKSFSLMDSEVVCSFELFNMNILLQIFVNRFFVSFKYISRNGITR